VSLDVYLQKDATLPRTGGDSKLVVKFEDDGYYWFLYPLFKRLEQKADKTIELYEDAFFSGDSLNLLNMTVCEAIMLISYQAEIWEECVGTIVYVGKRKIEKKKYSTVRKETLELMLINLKDAIKEAKDRNLGIFFFGD
jgi:hypothetical protein